MSPAMEKTFSAIGWRGSPTIRLAQGSQHELIAFPLATSAIRNISATESRNSALIGDLDIAFTTQGEEAGPCSCSVAETSASSLPTVEEQVITSGISRRGQKAYESPAASFPS